MYGIYTQQALRGDVTKRSEEGLCQGKWEGEGEGAVPRQVGWGGRAVTWYEVPVHTTR